MDLEDDSMMREMREFTKKEKKTPVQKSLFMDIEEAAREIKNKTQHGPVDISFDCPLNGKFYVFLFDTFFYDYMGKDCLRNQLHTFD